MATRFMATSLPDHQRRSFQKLALRSQRNFNFQTRGFQYGGRADEISAADQDLKLDRA
jgi:hypothetical protein